MIRLPKISNFTDFAPFENYPDVSLRYVNSIRNFGHPDLIIIPGTKSTIADLQWLLGSGLETLIKQAAGEGTPVFGICGGYQMLGKNISDPYSSETDKITECMGMDLLPVETVFRQEKVQRQTTGRISGISGIFSSLNGSEYHGYEIHMGQDTKNRLPVINSGNIYGTYIHGIFDDAGISNTIIESLRKNKGLPAGTASKFDLKQHKEEQYDLLAKTVRDSLDMDQIYSIIENK